MPDLSLLAIGLKLVLFPDLLFNSILYFCSKSSVESGIFRVKYHKKSVNIVIVMQLSLSAIQQS